MRNQRLFSLDLLRGLDMFYLVVGGSVLKPLLKCFGVSDKTISFVIGHPWFGFSLWDLIMPLFIFMAGAAVPFALGRRMTDGRPGPEYWRHVWTRVAVLWLLGMLAQGGLATLDVHQMIPYSNTLQTIALGYLAAAVVYPMKSALVKIAVPVALLVIYGLLIHFGGDYTKDGSLAQRFDLAVWCRLLPADNTEIAYIRKYGYSWLLPSMMFPVITLAGCSCTQLLRSARNEWTKAKLLLAFGAAALIAGLLLEFAGVRSVKHFFSVSFTLQAIGWSVLALDALYVLTDILRFRRGMGLFMLYGRFALTAYLCESVFREVLFAMSDRLFGGLARLFPEPFEPVVIALGFSALVTGLLWWRERNESR